MNEVGLPLTPLGDLGARGRLPANACSVFGPTPTGAQLRPADADATGGYYQPIVVEGLEPSVLHVRILCPLPDVPSELARELAESYEPNENPPTPELDPLNASLRAGMPQTLRVTWPAGAAQTFWWIPPGSSALAEEHESLRVSWFAQGARWASSASGAETLDTRGFARNTLTPDTGVTSVDVWVVLQDSRGGSSARHWELPVEP